MKMTYYTIMESIHKCIPTGWI